MNNAIELQESQEFYLFEEEPENKNEVVEAPKEVVFE